MDYEKSGSSADKHTAQDEVKALSEASGLVIHDSHDVKDMARLGKQQEFRRNFSFLSTLGFISIYMFVLISLASGLVNSAFGGLFWVFIGTVICYASVVLSLAEMSSMAPTAGGQYHWVSEFAPESCQRFLSYCAGWMSTLGWLASTAGSGIVTATIIQSIVAVHDESFVFSNWKLTLIMLAILAVTIGFNTWGSTTLPSIETGSLVAHLAGFVITVVAVLAKAPKNSASDVFTTFSSSSGWDIRTGCLLAQVTVLYANLGSDSIVHIAEEVNNSSLTVPRVMWWSYIINAILGIVALLVMLFCIGTLEEATSVEVPYLQLFLNTGSQPIAYVLLIILFLLIFSGNITTLATASREVFAFSRDKGLPGSRFWSKMNKKRHVPDNAVYLTSVCAGIICLINLGSSAAFQIVASLSLMALMSTYMLSIGSVALKRIRGQPLPPARWSLGRWGLPINIFACCYSGFAGVVMASFPTERPVDTTNANWAPAVWGGVLLLSILMYIVHGRKHYTAPVGFTEGRRIGGLQRTE